MVRDALVAAETAARDARSSFWALPVAAETYDGALNDINGMHVDPSTSRPRSTRRRTVRCPRGASAAGPG